MPDDVAVKDSILLHTKQLANIDEDDNDFDIDILAHINMAMLSLHQLGVGPTPPLVVVDKQQTWKDLIGDEATLHAVKTYFYYKTKLAFDPPPTAAGITSFDKMIEQLEYRLDVQVYSNTLRDKPQLEVDDDD